jgi:hypothetical protein
MRVLAFARSNLLMTPAQLVDVHATLKSGLILDSGQTTGFRASLNQIDTSLGGGVGPAAIASRGGGVLDVATVPFDFAHTCLGSAATEARGGGALDAATVPFDFDAVISGPTAWPIDSTADALGPSATEARGGGALGVATLPFDSTAVS